MQVMDKVENLFKTHDIGIVTLQPFHSIFTLKNGKTKDINTILLLSEILYWYRPTKDGKPKFSGEMPHLPYCELEDRLGLTKKQLARSFKVLEDLNIVQREVLNGRVGSKMRGKYLHIRLHFEYLEKFLPGALEKDGGSSEKQVDSSEEGCGASRECSHDLEVTTNTKTKENKIELPKSSSKEITTTSSNFSSDSKERKSENLHRSNFDCKILHAKAISLVFPEFTLEKDSPLEQRFQETMDLIEKVSKQTGYQFTKKLNKFLLELEDNDKHFINRLYSKNIDERKRMLIVYILGLPAILEKHTFTSIGGMHQYFNEVEKEEEALSKKGRWYRFKEDPYYDSGIM